jgi:hypothetical protein
VSELAKPFDMTLAAVVTTQIGNLFAQRTELTSIVHVPFFGNRLAAMNRRVGILS